MSNYENGPEEIKRIPRMPDAVLECIISRSLFRYHANRYEGEERDRLFGLMHDTAEEVLARVSLATPAVANGAAELPPLPIAWQCETAMCPKLYTDDQMQAYARAAIAASTQLAAPKHSEIKGLRDENDLQVAAPNELLVAALQGLLTTWENEGKEPGWVKRWEAAKESARAALASVPTAPEE